MSGVRLFKNNHVVVPLTRPWVNLTCFLLCWSLTQCCWTPCFMENALGIQTFDLKGLSWDRLNTNRTKQLTGVWKKSGWWQLKYFLFSPRNLGKIPILTNIFQMGWNHQPEIFRLQKGQYWGELDPSCCHSQLKALMLRARAHIVSTYMS